MGNPLQYEVKAWVSLPEDGIRLRVCPEVGFSSRARGENSELQTIKYHHLDVDGQTRQRLVSTVILCPKGAQEDFVLVCERVDDVHNLVRGMDSPRM
ncbi:hypothetical protein SAY87_023051 [Trapa incisa]|uniref:Uncharacterized protein n=1 Tax=Trapa incisa TaxID=236973 RepID=A0AAN7QA90_9MYRT|nr:hypothetical protein SAY87_023051 [Trapa incisa]